eukprot:CAMPEP_0114998796 /NCGR_PEP_ID=MMETSP0216-20121206/15741_1 /TAXON_ID=223996 /ORGANISM="Protocruzia adherens, Strain Boccale" /LENGTH=251 /DNA_ID=CAMNT_0002363503 /DNA_START=315 /DNA_END=1070 /DNA_ORIENTATION=+
MASQFLNELANDIKTLNKNVNELEGMITGPQADLTKPVIQQRLDSAAEDGAMINRKLNDRLELNNQRETKLLEKLERDYARVDRRLAELFTKYRTESRSLSNLLQSDMSYSKKNLEVALMNGETQDTDTEGGSQVEEGSLEVVAIDKFEAVGYYDQTALREKVTDVNQLRDDIEQIHGVFVEMNQVTHDQGKVLNQALREVEQTKADIHAASENLKDTREERKKRCKRGIYAVFFLVIVAGIFMAILYKEG